MVLGLTSTALFADAAKGQKLYSAKLKDACGVNPSTIVPTNAIFDNFIPFS
jgi:hypothetical protein